MYSLEYTAVGQDPLEGKHLNIFFAKPIYENPYMNASIT